MKKLLVRGALMGIMLISGTNISAQGIGNLLKNLASGTTKDTTTSTTSSKSGGGIISSLLGSAADKGNDLTSSITSIFSNKLTATKDKIIGTWVYEEPAVVMSSKNTLKSLGGKVVSSTIENKLNEKMQSYGIKKGCITMTFDKEGNFTQTFNGKTLKGTYTIEDKNINLKYSGKVSQIVGTTQLDGNNLLIVMDASKMLKYVNTLGSFTQNSTMKTAASLIGSMDGLECGLKLVKQ